MKTFREFYSNLTESQKTETSLTKNEVNRRFPGKNIRPRTSGKKELKTLSDIPSVLRNYQNVIRLAGNLGGETRDPVFDDALDNMSKMLSSNNPNDRKKGRLLARRLSSTMIREDVESLHEDMSREKAGKLIKVIVAYGNKIGKDLNLTGQEKIDTIETLNDILGQAEGIFKNTTSSSNKMVSKSIKNIGGQRQIDIETENLKKNNENLS